jgi:hypothetical protein
MVTWPTKKDDMKADVTELVLEDGIWMDLVQDHVL